MKEMRAMTETTTEQLAEIEGQAESTPVTGYTPPEGWRVLAVGEVLQPGDHWVNWEGTVSRPDIQHGDGATVSGGRYIRWVKPQPQLEPHAAAIEELRSEVSYVQNLLGTERRRVTELEELASSLRTINVTQEKAFEAAGKENTALRNQLAAVASVAADRQRLLIELDAAQQVPQAIADRFEEGWNQGTARAVETIVEWTEPIRTCGSQRLAWVVMANLPQIMRHLTGLAQD